jgi:hypothetical protein
MKVTLVNQLDDATLMTLDLDPLPRKDDTIEVKGKFFTIWRITHKIVPTESEIKYVEGVAVNCRPNNPYRQEIVFTGYWYDPTSDVPQRH